MLQISRRRVVQGLGLGALALGVGRPALGLGSSWLDVCTRAKSLPRKNGVLQLPHGTIEGSTQASAIVLEDHDNLTIDGNEAVLALDGPIMPFVFRRCRGITLRNFELQWRHPGHSQADILDRSADGLRLRIRIHEGRVMPQHGRITSLFVYDPVARSPMLGAREVYGKFIAAFEERGNGVVDCALTMPLAVPPGAVLVIKLNPGTGAAFNFGQSSGIDMENVRVTRAPQMAIAVQRSENFRAKGVRVLPKDDSLLATGADGLHLIQCRGAVTVEDCHFSNLGDDCVNVHDFYLAVDRWLRADAVQLMERSVFKIQNIATARYLPQVGDVVQFFDRGTLAVVGQTRVSSVDMSAPAPVIGFETSIEAARNGAPTLMCGTGSAPRISIAGSTFARSRARGLLLHSNASIENCHFQGFSLAGVAVEADGAMWGEGCGIGGVTIGNSTFSQCGLAAAGAVTVRAEVESPSESASSARGNGDIELNGNKFDRCQSPVLRASSVASLALIANEFGRSDASQRPIAEVSDVGALKVTDNTSDRPGRIAARRVTSPPNFSNNRNLSLD